MSKNIILVGMPGAGKTTVGQLLASKTERIFLDTDRLIQEINGRPLQAIVDTDGYMTLRQLEEEALLTIDGCDQIIATGGSAVYSEAAMKYLKRNGSVVFLEAEISVLRKRITDFETRGLAKRPDQTFEALFEERLRLYHRYADLTVDCSHQSPTAVCQHLIQTLPLGPSET